MSDQLQAEHGGDIEVQMTMSRIKHGGVWYVATLRLSTREDKIKFISLYLFLTFFRAEVEAYPAVSWSTSVPPHSAVLNDAICIHRWQARAHNSL